MHKAETMKTQAFLLACRVDIRWRYMQLSVCYVQFSVCVCAVSSRVAKPEAINLLLKTAEGNSRLKINYLIDGLID